MEIINISKDEFAKILFNENPIDIDYDSITTLKDDKLYKVYYSNIRDENDLNSKINILKEMQMDINAPIINLFEKAKELDRLSSTRSNKLITGVLSYNDIAVGVQMNYYEDFISLKEASKTISEEELENFLFNIYNIVFDLLNHDIVPTNIKEDNILVNIDSGEVLFNCLSDKETIFGPKNYVNDFPYQFKNVCGRINEMSKRLKNQQTLRLSI